jgi:uncharacterized membrane protein YhaH (DUF805 family)
VRLSRIFTARKHPVPRLIYVSVAMWLLFGVMGVLAHHPPDSKPHFLYVGSWVIVGIFAPLWAVHTLIRLDDLNWSKWWILACAAPWLFSIWASWQVRWIEFFIGMAAVILVQAPLVLLPARKQFDEPSEET